MEPVKDDPDLDNMEEISRKIDPRIDTEIMKKMIFLSVLGEQSELESLEKTHQPERELLNCLRGNDNKNNKMV